MNTLPLLFLLLVLAAYSHGDEKRIGRGAAHEHSSVEKPKFLAVHLHSSADAEHIAHTHGFRNRGKIGNITGHYLFEFTGSHKTEELKRHKHVLAHTPQESRNRVKRFMPSDLQDPLYTKQWHLHKDDFTATNLNVNVEAVWKMGYSGKGVTIGIVDDGVVPNHPDLAANFNAEGSYDVNFGKQDPTPFNFDSHGTEAAGVAAAGINNVCGVGVAPLAKVSGIRVLARDPTDAEEAIALHYRMDINDIYTCSWGPTDDGHLEGPGPLAENAIKQAIEQGRGGKGTIFVWAAGNGARAQDNCNYDGYVNSKYTIAIGAVNSGGGKTWYSESCAALTAVVPSSGNQRYIITTDIPNPSNGGCSQTFGGTSAASPMAAGIVALMLEANPTLTWRDVQDVIIRSAVTIDASHTSWGLNGAGLKFSHDYGFGLIDANATVTRALKHVNLPPYATFRSGRLPPFVGNKGQFLVEGHPNFVVEHVEAYVTSSGEQRGRTLITLKSPFGTLSQLMEPHNEVITRIDNWRFSTLACWGENPNGLWTLELKSTVGSSALKLEAWELVVYGHLSS